MFNKCKSAENCTLLASPVRLCHECVGGCTKHATNNVMAGFLCQVAHKLTCHGVNWRVRLVAIEVDVRLTQVRSATVTTVATAIGCEDSFAWSQFFGSAKVGVHVSCLKLALTLFYHICYSSQSTRYSGQKRTESAKSVSFVQQNYVKNKRQQKSLDVIKKTLHIF